MAAPPVLSTCQLVNLSTRKLVYLLTIPHILSTRQLVTCVSMILSPFAVNCMTATVREVVVSLRVSRAVANALVYGKIFFCLVFSKKFNIMSTLFAHQSPTLPQKIDSREGWFWCKMGVVANAGKMNIYVKQPPFTAVFGLFAAKYSAICR